MLENIALIACRQTTIQGCALMEGNSSGLLGRIGGMLLHPRRTLVDAMARPGRTADGMLIVAVTLGFFAVPLQTARALSLMTVGIMAGISQLVRVSASVVLLELVAVMILSSVVHYFRKKRPGAPSREGLLAAFHLTLVPFLTLMLIGAVLERTGLEPALGTLGRILPNHPWRAAVGAGAGWVAIKAAVAYFAPAMWIGWLMFSLFGRTEETNPQ